MEQKEKDVAGVWLGYALVVVALVMVAFQMFSVWKPLFDAILMQNIHLGFAFVILFLFAASKARGAPRVLFLLLIVVSLGVTGFIHVEKDRLDMFSGFPEVQDIVVGILLVAFCTYLTWKSWGLVFPILVAVATLYALFGHHLGGSLGHPEFTWQMVLSRLGIGFTGIYGMMLNSSANLIFLFIIFGSMFEVSGISKFFIEIGNWLGSHMRGGAAQTAVFSSSFVGMCTGAAAANVALTGSYTIPLMKKTGFKPEHAGAIEAMASTGGQLTPPVMGVAVFLMASFLGCSYAELMSTALIPAVMYYAAAVIGVILLAKREGIPMLHKKIDGSILIHGAPIFIIPMGLLTYLLIASYTAAFAAFAAIIALLVVSSLRKETRPPLKPLIKGVTGGVVMACQLAVACGMIGMLMSMITLTGTGPKLAWLIEMMSGGHLIIALFFTMCLAILLGCAMPTPVAYVIAALVVAPGLERMGISMLTAHFFVFYYAILSAVTPPVAGASMVGSQLAEAGYMKTSWESLKLAFPFFLLPYFIIYNPIILSNAQPLVPAILIILTLLAVTMSALIFAQRHLFTDTRWFEKIGHVAVILSLGVGYAFYTNWVLFAVGWVLFIVLIGYQWTTRKSAAAVKAPEPVAVESET